MLRRLWTLLGCATAGAVIVTAVWSLFRVAPASVTTGADRATSSTKVDSDDSGGEKEDVGLWSRVGNDSARIDTLEREIADLKRTKSSASVQSVSCPIITDDSRDGSIYWLNVYDSGPTNGVSCTLNFSAAYRGGSAWAVGPNNPTQYGPGNPPEGGHAIQPPSRRLSRTGYSFWPPQARATPATAAPHPRYKPPHPVARPGAPRAAAERAVGRAEGHSPAREVHTPTV